MKKIFYSIYGKDLATLLVALGISLQMHGWDVTNLIFLVGPFYSIYSENGIYLLFSKSPGEGEKAMIAMMAAGYLFLAIGFAGESAATLGKDVLTTLFTAAFYYLLLWNFTLYGIMLDNKAVKQPKYVLAIIVIALSYLLYEMFNIETFSKRWYQYAVIIIIGLVGISRQIILYNRTAS